MHTYTSTANQGFLPVHAGEGMPRLPLCPRVLPSRPGLLATGYLSNPIWLHVEQGAEPPPYGLSLPPDARVSCGSVPRLVVSVWIFARVEQQSNHFDVTKLGG
jgi:hypothetical protein